jgi:hypothetical protein
VIGEKGIFENYTNKNRLLNAGKKTLKENPF